MQLTSFEQFMKVIAFILRRNCPILSCFCIEWVNGFLNANQINESGLTNVIVNGVLNANQIRESGFPYGKCISSLSLFHVFCKGSSLHKFSNFEHFELNRSARSF